jgi:hypothetical protein
MLKELDINKEPVVLCPVIRTVEKLKADGDLPQFTNQWHGLPLPPPPPPPCSPVFKPSGPRQ